MLVLFDIDGVLINSEEMALESDCEFLAAYGLIFSRKEFIAFASGIEFGAFLKKLDERSLETNGRPLPSDFASTLRQHYISDVYPKIKVIEGVHSLIEVLKQDNIAFCAASNGDMGSIGDKLQMTGLSSLFEKNVFSKDHVPGFPKPFPDVFLFAARQMGNYQQGLCTVIDDSVAGVTAGVAAGMYVIGFAGGAHRPHDYDEILREAGADYIAYNMSDVADILEHRNSYEARFQFHANQVAPLAPILH